MPPNIKYNHSKTVGLLWEKLWSSFKEKWLGLLLNFIIMILGIVIGFRLEGCRRQQSMNDATVTRLGMMYLESQYNVLDANQIYDTYSDANSTTFNSARLDSSAAKVALEDENIFRVLTPLQVSLIIHYIDSTNSLNVVNEIHIRYLETVGYKSTDSGRRDRNKLRENSAAFLAVCRVFQDEFKHFFAQKKDEFQDIKKMETRIRNVKEKILKGQCKLEK